MIINNSVWTWQFKNLEYIFYNRQYHNLCLFVYFCSGHISGLIFEPREPMDSQKIWKKFCHECMPWFYFYIGISWRNQNPKSVYMNFLCYIVYRPSRLILSITFPLSTRWTWTIRNIWWTPIPLFLSSECPLQGVTKKVAVKIIGACQKNIFVLLCVLYT